MLRVSLVLLLGTSVLAAPAPKEPPRPTVAALRLAIGKSHLAKEVRAVGRALGQDPVIRYALWNQEVPEDREETHFDLRWKAKGLTLTFVRGNLHTVWMYNEKVGQLGAAFVFVGLNVTFFPQFILGTRGMPRRYYNYLPEFQGLHQLSTIGAYILGIGFLITAVSLARSLKLGRKAPANPWGASTLEWLTTSPPPYYNFHTPPEVTQGPYDGYESLTYDAKIGGYVPKSKQA